VNTSSCPKPTLAEAVHRSKRVLGHFLPRNLLVGVDDSYTDRLRSAAVRTSLLNKGEPSHSMPTDDILVFSFQETARRVRLSVASHFVGDVGSRSSSPQQVDASSGTSG